ncbi:unnamed protein product [Rhizoctonia solani]|uniref:Transmembrane protein n=2 Tax=Rhizoctonia solani TaxID=456999 RepID=A0A8H7H0M5_9AGAM|nr:uncharacterized protein RhiXN_07533 [Rhizoctonia solani]KAF8667845.1 hypothetical protein RHS04_09246 [Rhizoctonia solani]QRW25584.1 hypothetical protein RhiXN_07533 [Rhizoctonia solani]CAE6494198.1 unnamed protein product [Rhizoctonia solani]
MESTTATAPTASISQATSNESSSPGLPIPNIIGIAIACFFVLLCLILLSRWLYLRRKRARGGRKSVVWNNGGKHGMAENGGSTVRMVHGGGSASTQHLPPDVPPKGHYYPTSTPVGRPQAAYPTQSTKAGYHEPTTPRGGYHEPTTPRGGYHEPTTSRGGYQQSQPTTPTYATQSYSSRNPYTTRSGSDKRYAYPK